MSNLAVEINMYITELEGSIAKLIDWAQAIAEDPSFLNNESAAFMLEECVRNLKKKNPDWAKLIWEDQVERASAVIKHRSGWNSDKYTK